MPTAALPGHVSEGRLQPSSRASVQPAAGQADGPSRASAGAGQS